MPDTKTKLLIVEDDAPTRESLSQLFAALGYAVCAANDGFSALVELRLRFPDVILSDLNMPGMSGFELLSVVRRRFPLIRVIAMSGFLSRDGAQPGVPADAFYEKATDLGLLLKSMERLKNFDPEQSPRPVDTLTPVWIPGYGRDGAGRSHVLICCPECLRAFAQQTEAKGSMIQSATCSHCNSPLRFAIVEPTNPALPQAFQHKTEPLTAIGL